MTFCAPDLAINPSLKPIAEGAQSSVYVDMLSPGRVVKIPKPPGYFSQTEIYISTMMGKSRFSPRVFSSSSHHIEMEKVVFTKSGLGIVPGAPLWQGYQRTPEEKEASLKLTPSQTLTVVCGLCFLHGQGFYHGDMHNKQILTDGSGGRGAKIIDFGFSGRAADRPYKVLTDFSKIEKLLDLDCTIRGRVVKKYLGAYKSISRRKTSEKNKLAQEYLDEIAPKKMVVGEVV